MLINFTNHPSQNWGDAQKNAAVEMYGEILDLPFPDVDPCYGTPELLELGKEYENKMLRMIREAGQGQASGKKCAVLCQGEFTLSFVVIRLLQKEGIEVITATSQRQVVETVEDGITKKTAIFSFVRFRSYPVVG